MAANSNAVVTVARGERNSWEASPTKRRWAACPASMRASIAFIVCARREISSRAAGTATRSDRSAVLIADTWVRIRSTGRKERPTN